MSKGTSQSTDRFELGKDGKAIFHKPTYVCTDNGTRITLGFKVCTVEAIIDSELVCELLNLGHQKLNEGKEDVPAVDCDD